MDLWIKSKKQLNYFCYSFNRYKKYYLYQRNWKKRTILEPCKQLKRIQKRINSQILITKVDQLSENCYGFMPWKSIYDNALVHCNKEMIINIDIADFFPSITRQQVYNMFKYLFGFSNLDSYYLSRLTTYKESLPQWAPTSPMISNFIARKIDKRIESMISSSQMSGSYSYSRYADDITIWIAKPQNPKWIIKFIYKILEDEWFDPNYRKTKVLWKWSRREVTWLIINSWRPTIGKKKLSNLRAIFHSIEVHWVKKTRNIWNKKNWIYRSEDAFINYLSWWLSYLKSINSEFYEKYNYLLTNWI